jgi:hypothetical protein
MFGRLHCYYVRHITMFANVCHICGVCICSSHCDVTMHGRWKQYYVRHIMTFGNICHFAMFIYVRHVATLRCLVDWKFIMFVTLRRLGVFVTLQRHDMCVTMKCEEMFSTLRQQGDVGHIATCIYVRYIVTCIYVVALRRYYPHCNVMCSS